MRATAADQSNSQAAIALRRGRISSDGFAGVTRTVGRLVVTPAETTGAAVVEAAGLAGGTYAIR